MGAMLGRLASTVGKGLRPLGRSRLLRPGPVWCDANEKSTGGDYAIWR